MYWRHQVRQILQEKGPPEMSPMVLQFIETVRKAPVDEVVRGFITPAYLRLSLTSYPLRHQVPLGK